MTNPALTKLGLSPTDRAIIFHADDIGISQSSITAYKDLLDYGLLSSASTMVPCPWFPAAARLFRAEAENPRLDIGVHTTLTSETDQMRWGPISTRERATGLLDDEGYFYRTTAELQARADPAAVATELAAQVTVALDAGIDITHIDSHMGAVFSPHIFASYVQIGFQHRVPAFVFRRSEAEHIASGQPAEAAAAAVQVVAEVEANGMPILDKLYVMPLTDIGDRQTHAKAVLDSLAPGTITYFIVHPAHDTPELRALTGSWPARVGDYELFRSDSWRAEVESSNIHILNYRSLRDLMR